VNPIDPAILPSADFEEHLKRCGAEETEAKAKSGAYSPPKDESEFTSGVDFLLRTEIAQMIVATGYIPDGEGHTRHKELLKLTLFLKYIHCDEASAKAIILEVAARVNSTEDDAQIESEIHDMYNGRNARGYSSSYKDRDEFEALCRKTKWRTQ
jgi:hypothetical protein